jgi:3-hydroxyisobutyrate dehydrogenase-like beta-hydroxyacid dehydrogenase
MTDTEKIKLIKNIKTSLSLLHPSEAIAILEKLGKELRRANSIRINSSLSVHLLDMERPDLMQIK